MPKDPGLRSPYPLYAGLLALAAAAAAAGFWATGGRALEDFALLFLALWLGVLAYRAARGPRTGLPLLALRTLAGFFLFTAYLAIQHLKDGLWPSLLWTPLIYPGAYATLPPEAARGFLFRYFLLLVAASSLAFAVGGDLGDPASTNTYLQWLASQAALWVLSSRILETGRRAERAEREARTDPLTGLANRRAFLEALAAEQARAARGQTQPAVVMIDVDGLKAVNDRSGHAAGDRLLQGVARALNRAIREGDLVARLGGDEFAALLYRAEPAEALAIAERLRRSVAAIPARISLGVAHGQESDDTQSLLARADRALYRAKGEGGDRVCWSAGVS